MVAESLRDVENTPIKRLTSSVCRRAFSSPEALGYEWIVSKAVVDVIAPVVDEVDLAGSVLDVGCGGGRLAHHLVTHTGTSVVGIDPSQAQARRVARRGAHHAVTAVRGSASALPFAPCSFDGVVSSCALKHWPDPTEGVAECSRVARPGGPLVFVEIDGGSSPEEFRHFAQLTRVPRVLLDAYVRFAMRTVVAVAPSEDELAAIMRESGVGVIKIEKLPELPFLVAHATA